MSHRPSIITSVLFPVLLCPICLRAAFYDAAFRVEPDTFALIDSYLSIVYPDSLERRRKVLPSGR